MNRVSIAQWDGLSDRQPEYALVDEVDLVVVRFDAAVSVFYGRCLHRGALMADGHVYEQDNLICGVHNWDYRVDSGVSEYENGEALPKFTAWIEGNDVFVDRDEITVWAKAKPQPYDRESYLRLYQDNSHAPHLEPHNGLIQQYARDGLSKVGHHGVVDAMGVPRQDLPDWYDIQLLTAQLQKMPLLDDDPIDTSVVIGHNALKAFNIDDLTTCSREMADLSGVAYAGVRA